MIKIGFGYDIHPLVKNRDLIIGGIKIQHSQGLAGDSDADVLTHAIIDGILGALGLGDIGRVFGVGTPELIGISSLILLEKTVEKMKKENYQIGNIDATIIAQSPQMTPYINSMQNKLSEIIQIKPEKINIKSTTPKNIGALGQQKGIAVQAVILLQSINPEQK